MTISQIDTASTLSAVEQDSAAVLPFPGRGRERTAAALPIVVAHSVPMQRVLAQVHKLAAKNVNVLLSGETGTGKELIATSLHVLSARASGPLVRINCGAIPHDLVEAELFGHTRGAFSGAVRSRPGFFGAADGGTLVLDEIEALPYQAQATLLRAVQQGEVQTVGSESVRQVDVRLVACSNVNLAAEAEAGRFRRDLFFRLAVVTIRVPALRERPGDIEPLVRHFTDLYGRKFGVSPVVVPARVLRAVETMPWPGNVRQLESAIASMIALSDDGMLNLDTLEFEEPSQQGTKRGVFRSQVAAFEKQLLTEALARCDGNHSKTARALGLRRTTFLGILRRHGLWTGEST